MPDVSLWNTVLLPVCPGVARATLEKALVDGGPRLEAEIRAHHLAALWHAHSEAQVFVDARRSAALLYLKQRRAVVEIDTLLARENIPYAVIKGAATRELAYHDPPVRMSADVDILVSRDRRLDAARVLARAGYALRIDPEVISHEVVMAKDSVAIDLHWDILRPGRTPAGFALEMLNRRQRHVDQWVLSDADALFLMLVHGAISKHVSTTGLGLHRAVDLVLFLERRHPEDWPMVEELLRRCGLKTAAWTVLTWLRSLVAGFGLEDRLDLLRASVQPGRVRRRYLQFWVDQNLSARLTRRHAARLFAFSMVMHDRPAFAWQAWEGWRRARRTSAADARTFEQVQGPGAG